MVRFVANTVVVDDTNEAFLLVGFANDEHREALHFQRAYEFDEQDLSLGMNTVYAERNHQGQSGYGGVQRVELHPTGLRVFVSGNVAERMETDEFDIAFSLPHDEFERLRAALHSVFAGFGSLVECPA